MYDETDIISPIYANETSYIVPLRPPLQGTPHARGAQQRNSGEITTYFSKRKPREQQKHAPCYVPNIPRIRTYAHTRPRTETTRKTTISYLPPQVTTLDKLRHRDSPALRTAQLWHIRMNHTSIPTLQITARNPKSKGLPQPLVFAKTPIKCSGCCEGGLVRKPFKNTIRRTAPGHTVVPDIEGPLPRSDKGHHYFITFTESHTRFTLVYLLQTKAEAERYMLEAIAKIERHFGTSVARVRCDNANAYLTKMIRKAFGRRATYLDPTVPHTPQENSVSEHLNGTIMH